MNKVFFLNVSIVVVLVFLHIAKSLKADRDSYSDSNTGTASKRKQTFGLIPFPRVGRRNEKNFRSHIIDQVKRREGLIPFPRVGRSGKRKLADDISTVWSDSKSGRDVQAVYLDSIYQWMMAAIRDYLENMEANDAKLFAKTNQISDDFTYGDEANEGINYELHNSK